MLLATVSYTLGLFARRLNSSSSAGVMEVPVVDPWPSVATWMPTTLKYGARIPTLTFSLPPPWIM
ncbi:hypothetical protein DPMN_086949 [Dreissena polymorpha]|uniref:Uncharacterized protein n=1 Tax=Dreissena polymorpha TaxID=45954 RepID=A0A9D4KRC3_DREPO|nr:hypothetical protein DPMN_086949 [Dreissena polymorpha]